MGLFLNGLYDFDVNYRDCYVGNEEDNNQKDYIVFVIDCVEFFVSECVVLKILDQSYGKGQVLDNDQDKGSFVFVYQYGVLEGFEYC